jgi:sec-independent protein translocase protein TatA
MANLGFSELVVIFMILVLVFGASRLPAIGESIGKTVRGFKRGMAENQDIEVTRVEPSKRVASGAPSGGNIADAELVDDTQKSA